MPRVRLEAPGDRQPETLSILVVDDDPMVREATAWILAGAGHYVTEAEDGVAALEQLGQRAHFDLVISDIAMPRMNGLVLTRAVSDSWPGLPVLLVSGRPQPPGTHAFMAKPFNATTLLQAVATTVDTAKDAPYPGL
jgi:CheY-like chemotaxis protein